ncbi:YcgL domain-containing protein [Litorivicinus sp.]|nr:YcgL domain-containing protein [Litorivicinus sp.]
MRIIEIFKGNKKAEMYLYVDQKEGLRQVSDDLLSTFGQTESVMILALTRDKKLARVKAADVLQAIEQQGYFLQMPPPPEALVEAQIAAMVKAEEQLANTQNQEPTE